MNADKILLSIAIPAYNEEANIGNLLTSLLSQIQDNFELGEILVASDGSTDKTNEIVASVGNSKIKLIFDGLRKGKAERLNEINKIFIGDILVVLDADVILKGNLFLHDLIQPIINDDKIGLVGAKTEALPGFNFFEKVMEFGHEFKYKIYEKYNGGDNIYLCHGRARAFSKNFAKKLVYLKNVPEDAYSYFNCLEQKFKFHYEPTAIVLFRSPQTWADHFKQSSRFTAGKTELEKLIGPEKFASEYAIPKTILIKETVKEMATKPFLFFPYLSIVVYASLKNHPEAKKNDIWDIAQSSKQLNSPVKKNISVVTFYFYPVTGGLENHVLEVFSRLAKNGYKVTIHASKNTFTEINSLPENDTIKNLVIKRYASKAIGFWPKIDWKNTDLIILENYNVFPHGLLLIVKSFKNTFKKNKIKLFISPHLGLLPDWPTFGTTGRIAKKYYNKFIGVPLINWFADGVHAVSEYEKREIVKTGVKPKLVTIINNGLEEAAFDIDDSKVSQSILDQVNKHKPYLIQPARIHPVKNQLIAIKALALTDPKLNLIFIGQIQDPNYNQLLLDTIKELGLENRVKFLGVITGSDKYFLMKNSLASVHVSLIEAYSIAALELMSQKTIPIFSNHESFLEITNNGERGFILDTEDHKKLAEILNAIYLNPKDNALEEMKLKAFEYSKLKTWDKISEELKNYFNLNAIRD